MYKDVARYLALTLVASSVSADEIRDYYSEPGLNPFKASVSQHETENIDPFGGTLQLQYTDLSIPGNGGLDINIQRSYVSSQGVLDKGGVMGIGWTMHFGRVVVPAKHADKVCSQALWSVTTADNPSLEMPDGGRELLVLNTIDDDNSLITKTNWKVVCDGTDGFIAHKPDGTKYHIKNRSYANEETSWYVTKIVDKYGNTIDVSYNNFNGYAAVAAITASDGRLVSFEYDEAFRLQSVTSAGQVWQYVYESVSGEECNSCLYANLKQVIRPDGLSWQYEYNPGFPSDVPGNYSLRQVTYPHGAITDYEYQHVYFDASSGTRTTAISKKTNHGRGVALGQWTYSFYPNSVAVDGTIRKLDRTVVVGPDNRQEFIHYGYSYSAHAIDALWLVGLLLDKNTYSLSGASLEQQRTLWEKRVISDENFWHGRADSVDNYTYAAIPTVTWTGQNNTGQRVEYTNYDAYGNPGAQRETSYLNNYPDHVKTTTYLNDVTNWRIGLVTDEVVEGLGTVSYTLNSLGDVIAESRYGVITKFEYDAAGNISSQTDANNNKVVYSDYHRGVARSESQPGGVTIRREVNDSGTIASVTDGMGFKRSYTWTPMNELQSITFPQNAPVNIQYAAYNKTLHRGSYAEKTELDGFGRTVSVTRTDQVTGESIATTKSYDAAGLMVFESYPNSSVGTRYSYDGLGRMVKAVHPDGSFITTSYPHPVVERSTDERGNITERTYQAYGSAQNKRSLAQIKQGLDYTTIARNLLGQVTQVFQGVYDPADSLIHGYHRDFVYSDKLQLITETHPELGVVQLGRDAIGNLVSKQVGSQPATYFSYDARNRVVSVDYPGTTPDVHTAYDLNDKITSVTNSVASVRYEYDGNGNLLREVHAIDGVEYVVEYGIDDLDNISRIVYPSGRQTSLSPDAFGRPHQALPFVTAASYHPSGQIATLAHANGQTSTYTLNDRLSVNSIKTGGVTDAVDLSYAYYPDSHVSRIDNLLSPFPDWQAKELSYDALGRLTKVHSPNSGRTENIAYDSLGNILSRQIEGQEGRYSYTYHNGMLLAKVILPDWKVRWLSYDPYGNVTYLSTTDAFMTQLHYESHMVYDHAGNMVSGTTREDGMGHPDKQYGGNFAFSYSGLNKRVKQVTSPSGKVTHYVYSADEQLIGEYPVDDRSYGKEYFYVGSQLAAAIQKNRLPVANPGVDLQVLAGDVVSLNGTGSFDEDGKIVSYEWTQASGPVVQLQGQATSRASFTAPATEQIVSLSFHLTVVDNDGEQDAGTVTVTVNPGNRLPVANAGLDQTVPGGTVVRLDGSASNDADGSIIAYNWTQTSGPSLTLENPGTSIASFTAPILPQDTAFGFALTVTDDDGESSSDTTSVVVKDGVAPSTVFVTDRIRTRGVVSHTITLTSNEAGSTLFRAVGDGEVIGGGTTTSEWQTYTGPVAVRLFKGKANFTLEFYSVDLGGNKEVMQVEALK